MHDIVYDDPDVIQKCEEMNITPLVIGKDVDLVSSPIKTSTALLTLATSSKREVLESNIDGAVHIEHSKKKDFMHHRNSGLDQVTASILAKRQNVYVITLANIRQTPDVLGRVMQNVRIAKKFGIPVVLASFAKTPEELTTQHDQKAFWKAFGADAKILNLSEHNYETVLERSKKRQSAGYVAEGVIRG